MIHTIALNAIRFEAFIGCLASERHRKNLLECDVELLLDTPMESGPKGDHLECTLDYREIEDLLLKTASTRHFQMLESLGQAYLEALLAQYPFVQRGTIVLRKPGALPSGAIPCVTMVHENG